ncbi:D-isomer specific 2-hydroxyacid dehydrogenase family protein [Brucellaceae bacterium C25G]
MMTRAEFGSMDKRLKVSLAKPDDIFAQAVEQGGGEIVALGAQTRALIWNRFHDPIGLVAALENLPALEWIQLPSAGVEDYIASGVVSSSYLWTSAKGAYASPVAEHALTLTLAVLRQIQVRARATSWGLQAGKSLFNLHVAIVGGGSIAKEFMRLTKPFNVRTTIVRRSDEPVEGADRTVKIEELSNILPDVDVLLLAAALTDETRGIIAAHEFYLLPRHAVMINVARGDLVCTDDLTEALKKGLIAAAAMDVTSPEPLPAGHPLWSEPAALITPHTADTAEMIYPLLAQRIRENVQRFQSGEELLGIVDPVKGY